MALFFCENEKLFFMEVREDFFAEEAGLLKAIVTPELEHDLSAPRGSIFFEPGYAL